MQERINNTRNISKKRSENIKIPKKNEKIKEPNNLITSHIYSNNSINNSILLNKSSVKLDKKANIRNISRSTKCMKTNEKEKINPKVKTKNKYSITREKDREYINNINKKEENQNKSKRKYKNIKDILVTKHHAKEGNINHSFNHFKKLQSSNNSLRNIESSYKELNNQNNINNFKNNKIPRFCKYDKKNIILPFYYHLKKNDMKYNFKRKKIPNIRSDFNNVLKCLNKI